MPRPEDVERANLSRLARQEGLAAVEEVWRRAEEDPAWFWDAVVRELDIEWRRPYEEVLDPAADPMWPSWFRGGALNASDTCLTRHLREGRGNRVAVIHEPEVGPVRSLTYRELDAGASRLAAGLRALGVRRGDRVGLMLPMSVEAAEAVLACAKLGAIYCPAFTGHAPAAVVSRFADAGVAMVIAAASTTRRGEPIDLLSTVRHAVAELPSVQRVVVVGGEGLTNPALREIPYENVTAGQPDRFDGETMAPNDPLVILYTSGTTGWPKGAVHTHAGFLLKATADMAHAFDVRYNDVVLWVTDLGWIMGSWLIVAGLAIGATVVLVEGAPDHPSPDRLWKIVEGHRVSVLGGGPTLVRLLMGYGERWLEGHDLGSLRVLGSTGEPWDPRSWDWFFRTVGAGRCPIINYSGGTEIGGGILACFPIFPQRPCAFNGPHPGMAADCVDEEGLPIRGVVGELVLRGPWPGQTRGFWRDPERYVQTYWSRWPGLWAHGDLVRIDADGYWFILGRSDDTLNIAGKRVGPTEIELAINEVAGVRDSAVVGMPDPVKGQAVAAFVVVDAAATSKDVAIAVRRHVAERLGAAFRPHGVWVVPELPRTRNGKVSRRAVREAFLGRSGLVDHSVLENPEALEAIEALGQAGRQEGVQK